ncbi:MAG: NAD-dependent DNA ligase LigA [Ignavibacterium sp.]|nr:NAD-dependent DNA ligase LigA [Ignavibacterium sp.]
MFFYYLLKLKMISANLKKVKERIEKLKNEINYHRYLYHVLDKQEISDAALDSLKHELDELEKQYPEFITSDSPSQRVGGLSLDKFQKVRHSQPMLSLNDVFDEKEVSDWQARIKKLLALKDQLNYFAEIKMDGLAVSLIYKNGIFTQGATRGDGYVGENITQNLKTIEAIPLKLEIEKLSSEFKEKAKKEIEIRGEVFMSKKALAELNDIQKKNKEQLFANPRNAAAGSLRQLDSQITAQRKLDFYAYSLVTDLGQKTHQESHRLIKSLGFKESSHNQLCHNLDEVFIYYRKIIKLRSGLPYEIDGTVINVNDNRFFEKLGVVGKAPRGAIAYKFPGIEKITRIRDIIVQVGRTGKLTPIALLEPVKLSGVIISRATLHNQDEIARLGVKIGDTVIIKRAGDVIPDIVKVLTNLRVGKEKKFEIPKKCPFCGFEVKRKKQEVDYYCLNKKCFATQRRGLYHFVSKKAFDIEHLGPKIINQLINSCLIKDAADIFSLTQGDFESLERFAKKSAQNLIEAINQAKKISLARFIYALGIRHVGEETAQLLAQQVMVNLKPKITNLKIMEVLKIFQNFLLEDLQSISDIGPVVGQSIYNWFDDEKNIKFLEKFERAGVEFITFQQQAVSDKFKNKTFILTGALQSMTRDKAKEKIRQLGGKISSSISKETDFVVVGDEAGSKLEKAKRLNVKILNEQEFLKMIK